MRKFKSEMMVAHPPFYNVTIAAPVMGHETIKGELVKLRLPDPLFGLFLDSC
jgi:hypothetical protein